MWSKRRRRSRRKLRCHSMLLLETGKHAHGQVGSWSTFRLAQPASSSFSQLHFHIAPASLYNPAIFFCAGIEYLNASLVSESLTPDPIHVQPCDVHFPAVVQ